MAEKAKSRGDDNERSDHSLRVVPGMVDIDASHRLIHERARLAIISALAVNPSLSFSELKKLLEITDGNLSVHARKLEEAGLIKCSKSFVDRTPKTEYRLTRKGRKTLEGYLEHMEALIRSVRNG